MGTKVIILTKSLIPNFLRSCAIVCDRYASDHAHFTFFDLIWPLSLSWVFEIQTNGYTEKLLYLKMNNVLVCFMFWMYMENIKKVVLSQRAHKNLTLSQPPHLKIHWEVSEKGIWRKNFIQKNLRHFFSEQKSSFTSPAHIYCEKKPAKPIFAKCKCPQFYLAGEDSISKLTKCISLNCQIYWSIFKNVLV